MEQPKNRYLHSLSESLGNHPDKHNILLEYETHIDDLLLEAFDCENEVEVWERMIARLGSPKEIAGIWREELTVTPSRMRWLFVLLNLLFFGGGAVLTLAHNLFNWTFIATIWSHLTAIPTLIAVLYLFFWALLGYEIGKGFGHGGKRLLNKTFLLSLIPNLLLMVLTVFGIIPHRWFDPLLTNSFIITCIIFTIILYPVCWIGYKWGKKASV